MNLTSYKTLTRSTHAHHASRRAVPVRKCALRMRMGQVEQGVTNNLVRRTTVESNMKASIIYTWLVKTLHNVVSSFALSLVLFFASWLLLYIDFVTFSVSPTVGYVQHSIPQNMYVAEDQLRCPPRPPLSRSAVLPCPRPPSSASDA